MMMITEVKLFFLILYLVLIVPNIRVSHDLQGNDTIIIIIQSWQSVMIRLDHALITHSVFKSGNLDIFRFYIFLSCWWWGVGWCCDGYDDGVFRWLLEDTAVSVVLIMVLRWVTADTDLVIMLLTLIIIITASSTHHHIILNILTD